jgi:hypothetical protein
MGASMAILLQLFNYLSDDRSPKRMIETLR